MDWLVFATWIAVGLIVISITSTVLAYFMFGYIGRLVRGITIKKTILGIGFSVFYLLVLLGWLTK